MSALQFRVFLVYLIPFFIYFFIAGMVINSQMRLDTDNGNWPLWKAMLVNVVLIRMFP